MTTEITLKTTDSKIARILAESQSLVIDSPDSFRYADVQCQGIAALKNAVIAEHADEKKRAHELHKSICDKESGRVKPLDEARKNFKSSMDAYRVSEEKKRLEQEAILREQARARAENMALEAAQEAERLGMREEADAILSQPLVVATPIIETVVPKATTTIRKVRKFRIKNPGDVKNIYLTPDLVKIGRVVRALGKEAETAVGGIEVYEEAV